MAVAPVLRGQPAKGVYVLKRTLGGKVYPNVRKPGLRARLSPQPTRRLDVALGGEPARTVRRATHPCLLPRRLLLLRPTRVCQIRCPSRRR